VPVQSADRRRLKKRSPFIVTVILLTALRQREKSGQPSDLSKRLQEQVERMTKLTLFSPTSSLETVQGLAILVSYSEHAWRTCCHAMALAVDMRLYRCLPYLHKIRTDSRKPHHMLEKQRPLVVGARLWLAVRVLPHLLTDCSARPASLRDLIQPRPACPVPVPGREADTVRARAPRPSFVNPLRQPTCGIC